MNAPTMNAPATKQNLGTLVVGLGSPHGDDQAGWKVIERLEPLQLPRVELRQATVPHDLLDWIEGRIVLHLIDGCIVSGCSSESHNVNHQRFEVVEDTNEIDSSLQFADSKQRLSGLAILERPTQLRSAGSHQIDVYTVLELAACLNRLPKRVVLWTLPGQRFAVGNSVTSDCEIAILSCVGQLTKELGNA